MQINTKLTFKNLIRRSIQSKFLSFHFSPSSTGHPPKEVSKSTSGLSPTFSILSAIKSKLVKSIVFLIKWQIKRT